MRIPHSCVAVPAVQRYQRPRKPRCGAAERSAGVPALLSFLVYQWPTTGRSVDTPKDAVMASTPEVQVKLPSISR